MRRRSDSSILQDAVSGLQPYPLPPQALGLWGQFKNRFGFHPKRFFASSHHSHTDSPVLTPCSQGCLYDKNCKKDPTLSEVHIP